MKKFTRHIRRCKKNKTLKRGGANLNTNLTPQLEDERNGVLDIVGDKVSNIASSAAKTIGDAGLKIAGLERIQKTDNIIDEKVEDKMPNALNNVEEIAEKSSSALLQNLNEVLGSEYLNKSVKQAGEETAEITKKLLGEFNEAMNNPEVKEEVNKAIINASEVGSVLVDAAKEPFNKMVNIVAEEAPKATSAALSGAIKVGTDAMAAIPGVGGIIEVGKIINDSSKAASAVIEAGSEAVEAASDAFLTTKENFERGMKELEEKKKIAEQISNRTNQSINQFENPISTAIKPIVGGRRTRRRFLKRKSKSKRVRFSI